MDLCTLTEGLSIAGNQTLLAAYCAADNSFPDCFGLCANADVSGVGVRIAFYSQSIMNVLLIWLSPDDASGSAWSGAVLTFALVIPAIYSKSQRNITLHHAVLVLNFATLSTIASIAAAPMVPIWRRVRHAGKSEATYDLEVEDRTRGRVILSFALLAQIIMQWLWAIILFVDPFYAQAPCSGATRIYFLGGNQSADQINDHFGVWAFWLLLCLCSSLIFGVIMVFSSPLQAHDKDIIYHHHLHDNPTFKERTDHYIRFTKSFLWPEHDPHFIARCWIRLSHLVAFLIAFIFVILSELQIQANHILPGETNIWSFSQSAAILLALAPAWPIGIAYLRRRNLKKGVLPRRPGEKAIFSSSPKSLNGDQPLPDVDSFSPTSLAFEPKPPTMPDAAFVSDHDYRKRHLHDVSASSATDTLSYFPALEDGRPTILDLVPTSAEVDDEDGETPSNLENGFASRPTPTNRRPPPRRQSTQQDLPAFSGDLGLPLDESGTGLIRRSRPGRQSVSFVPDI